MSKMAHELEKLRLVLPEGTTLINKLHIERNIGISKDYNNFELTKALGQKNVLKANRIADLIREHYSKQEVEVQEGGQPHYQFIISIE